MTLDSVVSGGLLGVHYPPHFAMSAHGLDSPHHPVSSSLHPRHHPPPSQDSDTFSIDQPYANRPVSYTHASTTTRSHYHDTNIASHASSGQPSQPHNQDNGNLRQWSSSSHIEIPQSSSEGSSSLALPRLPSLSASNNPERVTLPSLSLRTPRVETTTQSIIYSTAPPHMSFSELGHSTTPDPEDDPSTQFAFVNPPPAASTKKRPRRRYEEIERHYRCNYENCTKAYGTLNHLNAHIVMQKHGEKRDPAEFKEMRKIWRNREQGGNRTAGASSTSSEEPVIASSMTSRQIPRTSLWPPSDVYGQELSTSIDGSAASAKPSWEDSFQSTRARRPESDIQSYPFHTQELRQAHPSLPYQRPVQLPQLAGYSPSAQIRSHPHSEANADLHYPVHTNEGEGRHLRGSASLANIPSAGAETPYSDHRRAETAYGEYSAAPYPHHSDAESRPYPGRLSTLSTFVTHDGSMQNIHKSGNVRDTQMEETPRSSYYAPQFREQQSHVPPVQEQQWHRAHESHETPSLSPSPQHSNEEPAAHHYAQQYYSRRGQSRHSPVSPVSSGSISQDTEQAEWTPSDSSSPMGGGRLDPNSTLLTPLNPPTRSLSPKFSSASSSQRRQ